MKTGTSKKAIGNGFAYLFCGLVLVATGFLISTASCNDTCSKRDAIEVVVLVDVTEEQLSVPDYSEIVLLFGLDTNKWDGAVFRFAYLTDVSYNHQTTLTLPVGGNRLTSSSFTRDREVQKFEDSLQSFLQSLSIDSVGRPHSSIYVPLANELARLAKSGSSHRSLLVYSDLMENEQSLSFYDKKTIGLLRTDPEKISMALNAKAELPDLTGIDVHLIFQPQDAAQDDTFRLVSGFYKTLLESRGAKVTIAANVLITTK